MIRAIFVPGQTRDYCVLPLWENVQIASSKVLTLENFTSVKLSLAPVPI